MADAGTGWGAVGSTTRWFAKPADPHTRFLLLRDELSPCELACVFCPHSLHAERPPPVDDDDELAAIVADFEAELAATDARQVFLVSMDILAFPALGALLERASAAGKRVLLGSPGTHLSDPAIRQLLLQNDVTVHLTLHGTSPDVTEAMVGDAAAHARIEHGLRAARSEGLNVELATVVTSRNVHQLHELIAHVHEHFSGQPLTLRAFYPDLVDAPAHYLDLFASWQQIQQALERAEGLQLDPPPRLVLGNVPCCQLDLAGLRHLDVVLPAHEAHQNTYKTAGIRECLDCEVAERCVRVHPDYVTRHEARPVRAETIAANLALGHPPTVTNAPVPHTTTGPPPDAVLPGRGVLPGQGILPGEGVPRGLGRSPGQATLPPPRPPSGPPTNQRIPRELGRLPGEGVLPGVGMLPGTTRKGPPPNLAVPRGVGIPKGKGRPPTPRLPREASPGAGRPPLLTLRERGGPVLDLRLSADGRWLLALQGGAHPVVRPYDLHHLPQRVWQRHPRPLPAPAWASTLAMGNDVASALFPEGQPGRYQLRQLVDGTVLGGLQSSMRPEHLAVHPWTGRWLVGGAGLVLHAPDGHFLRRLMPVSQRVIGLVPVHPDRVLVTTAAGTIHLLSLEGEPQQLPELSGICAAAWSRLGTWLVTADAQRLTVRDGATGRTRWRRAARPGTRHLAITSDERHLVAAGGDVRTEHSCTLRIWNLDAGAKRAELIAHAAPVTAMALHHRTVATGSASGEICVWDLTPELSGPRSGSGSEGRGRGPRRTSPGSSR